MTQKLSFKDLKIKFIDLLNTSSDISVDGVLFSGFVIKGRLAADESAYMSSEDPAIYIEYESRGEPMYFIIKSEELDAISLSEDGNEWSVGGYVVSFNTVEQPTGKEYEFDYSMLGRLKMDCEYYLGNGGRAAKHLYYQDAQEHIEQMKALHNKFPDHLKPEWLTMEQISEYGRAMLD